MWRESSYGLPQEMTHFADCVANGPQPLDTIFAAYESAGTGRKVELPFTPLEGNRPIEVWLR